MGQVSSTCWQDAPIVKEKNPNRLADAQKKLQTCARALRNRMVSWMGNHWWGTGGRKGVGSFAMSVEESEGEEDPKLDTRSSKCLVPNSRILRKRSLQLTSLAVKR